MLATTLCDSLSTLYKCLAVRAGCPPKKFPTDFRSLLDQSLPGFNHYFFNIQVCSMAGPHNLQSFLVAQNYFNLSPFPHSLSISSFTLHYLAARLPQFVQPCLMIKMIVRPGANRSSRNFFGTPCVAFAVKQTPHPVSYTHLTLPTILLV